MAASFGESQKLDYLWKKLGYGVAKTSIPPPGSGSKEAFNESIASPLLYRGDLVMTNSGDIPGTPPAATTSIVEVYKDGVGSFSPTVQCTEDLTAPDNQTWKTNLANWIPTQFGDNYLVVVYVDTTGSTTPQTTGTRLFQAGSGSDDTWFFDYQAGILNFNGATIPSVITGGVTGKSVFIVGYRYVGTFGVGGAAVLGNLTISNTTISTSLANGNITLTSTGTGLVTIAGTAGIIVPAGNTAQRPDPPTTSTLRVNTQLTQLEYYDGSNWVSSAGDTSAITNQTLNGDGSTVIFTLDYEATAESILVSINGVLQTPGIDYTTTGTTLTFTTAPAAGDVIQVRFIAAITVISALVNGTSNIGIPTSSGNVTIGSGGTANVLVVDPTGVTITGNLTVSGNATLSGNILGDRIQNGTTTIDIQSVNGNANITVAGTSNVAVFATTGVYVTGIVSATANITGGNVLFGSGIISGTGNITGGNLSVGTGTITVGNVVNGNGNGVGNIGSSSTYFNTVFAKATSAQYADLAELYSADAVYTPGTVVSFGGDREITLTTLDTDPCVAGVVSTNPAHLMNSGIFCEFPTALALQGRVPCRVVGNVTAGAMMVSAGNGCARAEKSPAMGTVIGKAVENFSENMPGIIEIVVGRL
jgi:hypothetical protein